MLWAAERPVAIVGGSGWTHGRHRLGAALRRALRHAGRRLVPPRERARRRTSQLRRRDRHRRQSEAEGAHRAVRPRAADRRTHVRGGLAGLHAVRHSGADPEARPRPSRRAGDRAQLSPDAGHRRDASGLRRRAGGRAAADDPHLVRSYARGARGLPRLERTGARDARAGSGQRDHVHAAPARPRRDLHHRRRQFRDLGRTLPALSHHRAAARADLGLDGLRPARRDFGQATFSPTAPSSASPATAIS